MVRVEASHFRPTPNRTGILLVNPISHSRKSVMLRIRSLLLLLLLTPAFARAENTRIRDVIYGRKFGMALTMDVIKPEKPSGVGVLFMISGGFTSDPGWRDAMFAG